MRATSVLFAALVGSWLPGQAWNRSLPTNPPSPRRAGAMAFDGVGNRLLLHGGMYASPSMLLEETWSYNGAWTLLAPTSTMPGRWGHRLVRDTLRNRLVTFGGRSPTPTAFASDTWAWNGSGWVALPTTQAPEARYVYGLAYDRRRDRVVLFGGRTPTDTKDDTWEFDGADWTEVATATRPAPRGEMVFVHDVGRATTVMFGGFQHATTTVLGDTWEYDGVDWREITAPNPPTPRYRCAADYDSQRQRVVVYGGYDGAQLLTQTLEYSGGDWVAVATSSGTTNPTECYAGFDSVRNRFVTFGGVGTAFSDETWEFTGAATATFAAFGRGCPTAAGEPGIESVGLPRLGQTFDVVVTGLPGATSFVVCAMGFSALTWNGNALPFDLGPLGASGCALEVSPDVLLGLGAANGTATLPFPLPATTSLTNLAIWFQVLAPDAGAPNGVAGATRGARAVLGS